MVRRLSGALRSPAMSASLLSACALLFPFLVACGGGDEIKTVPKASPTTGSSPSSADNDPSPAPTLQMPASRFALSLDDLGNAFITNVPDTYRLDADIYSKTPIFPNPDEGKKSLKDWGYLGGYETSFRPEGGDVAVLNGAFHIYVEVHLFSSAEGAKKAYEYFDGKLRAGASPADAAQVGNLSSAWKLTGGKIRNSSVDAADHRLLFRRGNLVAVVRTLGADPFMKVDTLRTLAVIVDSKALGKTAATEPTPTSNFTPAAGGTKASPSPTGTARAR